MGQRDYSCEEDAMKTLYVSDLDGTLLREDQRTSAYTNRCINELTDAGLIFTYATARAWQTSHQVTEGLLIRRPGKIPAGLLSFPMMR